MCRNALEPKMMRIGDGEVRLRDDEGWLRRGTWRWKATLLSTVDHQSEPLCLQTDDRGRYRFFSPHAKALGHLLRSLSQAWMNQYRLMHLSMSDSSSCDTPLLARAMRLPEFPSTPRTCHQRSNIPTHQAYQPYHSDAALQVKYCSLLFEFPYARSVLRNAINSAHNGAQSSQSQAGGHRVVGSLQEARSRPGDYLLQQLHHSATLCPPSHYSHLHTPQYTFTRIANYSTHLAIAIRIATTSSPTAVARPSSWHPACSH
jgi:hypothetical protein